MGTNHRRRFQLWRAPRCLLRLPLVRFRRNSRKLTHTLSEIFEILTHVKQLPWLRIDAIALNLVWLLPYFSTRAGHSVIWAWKLAACFIPISYVGTIIPHIFIKYTNNEVGLGRW